MEISIESIQYSEEMINYLIDHNLKLESISLSINNHLDLIISGDREDLINLLFEWEYLDNSLDHIDEEISDYLGENL
jgi:hypothetical protein